MMNISKKEAAVARAAAAQKAEAGDRLSALESERRGYVQRGDEKGVAALDEEIAHWSQIVGIPLEAGEADDTDPSLEEALAGIELLIAELGPLREAHAAMIVELEEARTTAARLEQENTELKAAAEESPPILPKSDDSTPAGEVPVEPEAKGRGRGRANTAAAAKE